MSEYSSHLIKFLQTEISTHGPMGLDRFIGHVLGHPEYGYYMTRDPLGRAGDFTTAPEISQMFGEMVGAWLANMWMQHGKPPSFILLEMGPGRGTLMADVIRVCGQVPGFMDAAQVHLVEMSPVLKSAQKNALNGMNVTWHETLDTLPCHNPIFFVANEFFDALPFKQYIYSDDGWAERCVDIESEDFVFTQQMVMVDPLSGKGFPAPKNGDVYEDAFIRDDVMKTLCKRIRRQAGAGLIIDYGHLEHGFGDTFQALKAHEYSNPLNNIGESDLTSHVDFAALKDAALQQDVQVLGMAEQGYFLQALGIQLRARHLLQKASGETAQNIQKALHRLVHSDEMGTLFKVIGLNYGASVEAAGFR